MVASLPIAGAAALPQLSISHVSRPSLATMEALHDRNLVRRFNLGDESAFVEIISRYHEKMFAVAFALLRNRADAEEIAQDTMIRAYRGLTQFRGDSSLATWLHRIALNLSRNRYWYNHRRRQHAMWSLDSASGDEGTASLAQRIASDAPNPVQVATTTEFSELVARCMQQLGPGHREILTRRNVMNHSYGDIARSLGISIGTVKSRIARARENLRALLALACPEFPPNCPSTEWFDPARSSGRLETVCA